MTLPSGPAYQFIGFLLILLLLDCAHWCLKYASAGLIWRKAVRALADFPCPACRNVYGASVRREIARKMNVAWAGPPPWSREHWVLMFSFSGPLNHWPFSCPTCQRFVGVYEPHNNELLIDPTGHTACPHCTPNDTPSFFHQKLLPTPGRLKWRCLGCKSVLERMLIPNTVATGNGARKLPPR